jgi:hypothetical protein
MEMHTLGLVRSSFTLLSIFNTGSEANGVLFRWIDSGKAGLWEKAEYRKIATQACVYIAQQIEMDPVMQQWVVGLQIVNEAAYSDWGVGGHAKEWYTETLVGSLWHLLIKSGF